jgi:hypothetical protein
VYAAYLSARLGGEGRSPHLAEFQEVAAGVLRDAFAGLTIGNAKKQADVIADMAFHGRPTHR